MRTRATKSPKQTAALTVTVDSPVAVLQTVNLWSSMAVAGTTSARKRKAERIFFTREIVWLSSDSCQSTVEAQVQDTALGQFFIITDLIRDDGVHSIAAAEDDVIGGLINPPTVVVVVGFLI